MFQILLMNIDVQMRMWLLLKVNVSIVIYPVISPDVSWYNAPGFVIEYVILEFSVVSGKALFFPTSGSAALKIPMANTEIYSDLGKHTPQIKHSY